MTTPAEQVPPTPGPHSHQPPARPDRSTSMHLVAIGGSDAGISAALRARELDPTADVTVVVADAYPNFSICGIPYYVSGEVTHWRNLAHRTIADLEATGMKLRLTPPPPPSTSTAAALTVTGPDGSEELLGYDELIVGTGAVPVRPPIEGLAAPARSASDGVHLLHSMGDTFALMRTLDQSSPETARHRRRRLHRPGDGRRPHHPRHQGHPDRAAARGAAHRRPRTRRARPRRARPATASTSSPAPPSPRSPAPTGRPGPLTSTATAAEREPSPAPRTSSWSSSASDPTPTSPPAPAPRLGARHAIVVDRPMRTNLPRRLRRRRLRRHPPPAARRDLPAARHHRPQAGTRRRGERTRRRRASSPAASAPRSSRSSTSSPPGPACATTKP